MRTPTWWFKRRTPAAAGSSPAVDAIEADPSAPAPRVPGVDLKFDGDGHRIRMNISYTSAIIAAFTVVVVVSLAYIVGRHMTRGPAAALAGASTEQIRQGPIAAGVLDVNRASSPAKLPQAMPEPEEAMTADPSPTPSAPATQPAGNRIIGRNYVVMQIYPDEKGAIEARDVLLKHGIACTVEQGLSGYAAKSWYCVVGSQGFDRIRGNAEYDRYEKAIRDVSAKFAGNSKFKKFDPQAYRWRG